MTPYVDAAGKTLLVLARLRDKARVFATERRPPSRRRGDPPPAPPPEQRAEAWAKELAAPGIEWREPRPVSAMGLPDKLVAALLTVQADLTPAPPKKRRSA